MSSPPPTMGYMPTNSGALYKGLGQNMPSGITTFPGISAASIIAATPGLQAAINVGYVIQIQE